MQLYWLGLFPKYELFHNVKQHTTYRYVVLFFDTVPRVMQHTVNKSASLLH